MTITLTVTAKGQVTLRKKVLDHLGIGPGDRLEIELLPAGRVEARARPKKPVSATFGLMKRPGEEAKTLEEIDQAIASGWAGER